MPQLFLLDIILVIFIYKHNLKAYISMRITLVCLVFTNSPPSFFALLDPLWFYQDRNSFGVLQMMSKAPTHLYRQISFLSWHRFTLLSLFPKRVEDRQTHQASYRSDFPSLKTLNFFTFMVTMTILASVKISSYGNSKVS